MSNQYSKTEYDYTVKQISDHEIQLTVDNFNIKEYIERVLDDLIEKELSCSSHSKYDNSIIDDYELFYVDEYYFKSIYKIKGKRIMATFAMFLINQAMQNYRNLEFCELMQPYTDELHPTVKIK